jgi:protein-S-isoprenylcysteine O-methyltransferase Ste14
MKKIALSIISNVIMVFLPLLGHPSLVLHSKILIIIAGSVCIWLTQPAFSVEETNEEKQNDKFSVLLIITMSLVSCMVPIIDWAYFSDTGDDYSWITVLGIVMIGSGIWFRAWAVRTLGQFFTPTVQIQKEHRLINSGPYQIIRHPSYFAAFLSITGAAVLLQSIIGISVSVIAMSIAYYVRIGIEERKLIQHFGNQYREYMLRTKRIIPFVF